MQIDLSRTVNTLKNEYNLSEEQSSKDWDYIMHLIKTELEDDCPDELWRK
jgi:hypothetical protein